MRRQPPRYGQNQPTGPPPPNVQFPFLAPYQNYHEGVPLHGMPPGCSPISRIVTPRAPPIFSDTRSAGRPRLLSPDQRLSANRPPMQGPLLISPPKKLQADNSLPTIRSHLDNSSKRLHHATTQPNNAQSRSSG
eukprot:Selendium_serpulae@DN2044_c0_g1_i3.p1